MFLGAPKIKLEIKITFSLSWQRSELMLKYYFWQVILGKIIKLCLNILFLWFSIKYGLLHEVCVGWSWQGLDLLKIVTKELMAT